jgi:hypothetical protein
MLSVSELDGPEQLRIWAGSRIRYTDMQMTRFEDLNTNQGSEKIIEEVQERQEGR